MLPFHITVDKIWKNKISEGQPEESKRVFNGQVGTFSEAQALFMHFQTHHYYIGNVYKVIVMKDYDVILMYQNREA